MPATYTILGIPATITAHDKTIAFADATPVFTSNATGLIGGDALGTVAYSFSGGGYGPSETPPTNVGTYTITPTVLTLNPGTLGQYSWTVQTGTFTIVPKAVTVSAAPRTKVFGQNDPPLTFTTSPSGVSLNGALTRQAGEDVATYTIGQGTVTNANNSNYSITYNPADFTITQATVTVSPTPGQSKVYGDADPTLTYSTDPNITLTGALSRVAGLDVGNYLITQGTVTSSANYIVVFTNNVTFEITPRPLTIKANDQSSTFGDALPANGRTFTVGNLVNGDTLDNLTYTYTPTASPSDAGTYTITPSMAVVSASASNYDITYATGTLTIAPLTVTVTPDTGQTKVFGDPNPTYTYALSPALPGGVTISGALARAPGENVGTYAFELGTLATGTGNVVLELTNQLRTFAITRLPITVTADPQTKVFGQPDPSLTFTTSLAGVSLSGTLTRAPGTDVGTYAIAQGTVTNATNLNYDITYTGANLVITQANVTVTPDAGQSKVFDDPDPTLTYTVTPSVTLSGTLSRVAGSNVGTYNIEQGTVTSTPNYVVTFTTGVTFAITRKPVTVSADANQTKVFDDPDPTFTYTTEPAGITLSGALSRASGANVGTYAITQGTVDNTNNGNYNISFVSADMTITPLVVTVNPAAGQTKQFGQSDPTFTYTTPGLPGGVTITGLLGREAGEDVNTYVFTIGTLEPSTSNVTLSVASTPTFSVTPMAITVTADPQTKVFGVADPVFTYTTSPAGITLVNGLSRAPGTDVGTYAITRGTIDADNPNYTITSYTGANLTITRATVVITPDSGQSKGFGDNDPTLTYSSSPDVGSSLTGALGRAPGESIGDYVINLGTLVLNTANYEATVAPGTVTFAITTRPVTLTANGHTITYGQATPANTLTVTGGLVSGDSLSGGTFTYEGTGSTTYGPSTTAPTDAGTYSITPSGATINGSGQSNYAITYAAGTLTINRAPLVISLDPVSVYFGAGLDFTVDASGLVSPDELGDVTYTFAGGGYGPSSEPPAAVGSSYNVTPTAVTFSQGSADNYSITFGSAQNYTVLPTRAGALFPDRGTYLGGTFFTIVGAGFGPPGSQPSVIVGGRPATGVVLVNNTMIVGITPDFDLADQYTEELVDVGVYITGGGTVTLSASYTYLPPRRSPVMATLFPTFGPQDGGTELTISGEHLGGSDQSPPTVFVNGARSGDVTVTDDGTYVTAITPPGPPGTPRDVELFTNEGAAGFLSAFTYLPPGYVPPTITDVSPARAYTVGGVPVVITGTNFGSPVPIVRINGSRATVISNSPNSVTIMLPPGVPGVARIDVIPPASPTGATDIGKFGYVATPDGDATGVLWLDLNKNGRYDAATEPPLPNLPVVMELVEYVLPALDDTAPLQTTRTAEMRLASASLQTGEATVVIPANRRPVTLATDSSGRYAYRDLPYGDYRLRLQLPDELEPTYLPPGSVDGLLNITIEDTVVVADAGGAGTASLLAYVADQDGALYRNSDVDIRWWGPDGVMGNGDDVLIPFITGPDGSVQLRRNLPGGDYRVERVDEAGERYMSNTLRLKAGETLQWEYFILALEGTAGDGSTGGGQGGSTGGGQGGSTGSGVGGAGDQAGDAGGDPLATRLPSTGTDRVATLVLWATLILALGAVSWTSATRRTRRQT